MAYSAVDRLTRYIETIYQCRKEENKNHHMGIFGIEYTTLTKVDVPRIRTKNKEQVLFSPSYPKSLKLMPRFGVIA